MTENIFNTSMRHTPSSKEFQEWYVAMKIGQKVSISCPDKETMLKVYQTAITERAFYLKSHTGCKIIVRKEGNTVNLIKSAITYERYNIYYQHKGGPVQVVKQGLIYPVAKEFLRTFRSMNNYKLGTLWIDK